MKLSRTPRDLVLGVTLALSAMAATAATGELRALSARIAACELLDMDDDRQGVDA